ncbi:hypothetical protein BGX30_009494, partial [Mortierella sp. GBA39]
MQPGNGNTNARLTKVVQCRDQYPYTDGPLRMRIMYEDFPLSVELEPCTAVFLLSIA